MKTKLFLSMLAFAGILFITSCEDDSPAPLSKQEATTTLNTVSTDYVTIRTEYENSQGATAQSSLDSKIPFDAPSKAPSHAETIKNEIVKRAKASGIKSGDGPYIYFNFSQYVGTWTYNSSTYSWTHTSSPADKIVLIFPFTFNGTSKTATATYYDYTYSTFNQETYATGLKFKIEVDGAIIYSWAYTASQTLTSDNVT